MVLTWPMSKDASANVVTFMATANVCFCFGYKNMMAIIADFVSIIGHIGPEHCRSITAFA